MVKSGEPVTTCVTRYVLIPAPVYVCVNDAVFKMEKTTVINTSCSTLSESL